MFPFNDTFDIYIYIYESVYVCEGLKHSKHLQIVTDYALEAVYESHGRVLVADINFSFTR